MEDSSAGRVGWRPLAAAAGFVLFIQAVWWATGSDVTVQGGFADGDSYTRLLRVERLVETGDWLDIRIPRANAPYGTTVHWTRLFDIVLLALAAPLMPLFGVSKALFWAGTFVSPLVHLASAAAVAWAAMPLLGRVGAAVAGGLTAAQIGILAFSLPGRADHHMMFILIGALALGYAFRALRSVDDAARWARACGLMLAVGIWEGPEFLVFMALMMAAMGLPWLAGQPSAARRNRWLAEGLFAGLVVVTLVERAWSGYFAVEYDRISIVHVTLAALILAYWSAVAGFEARLAGTSVTVRVLLAIAGAGAVAGISMALFPLLLSNPLDNADPAIQPIYAHISEYRPIRDVARFLVYLGSALFVVPWLLWTASKRAVLPSGAGWSWLLVGLGVSLYGVMGFLWLRWTLYAALFLVIPLAAVVVGVDAWISARFEFPRRLGLKALAVLLVTVGPLGTGALMLYGAKTPAERAAAGERPCPVAALADVLNAPPYAARPLTIVASANFGPELMYRTPHRVVATVHHRNVAGILDGHRILNSADEAVSRKLMEKRRVDLLVLCPGTGNDRYFLMGGDPDSLYRRLLDGRVPAWLRPLALPGTLGERFRLFGAAPVDGPGIPR